MKEKPVVAQKGPYVLDLQPGIYWWCSCGRSSKQPWCDGSHRGTRMRPVRFDVSEPGKYPMCGCKHTGKKPRCDGSHNEL